MVNHKNTVLGTPLLGVDQSEHYDPLTIPYQWDSGLTSDPVEILLFKAGNPNILGFLNISVLTLDNIAKLWDILSGPKGSHLILCYFSCRAEPGLHGHVPTYSPPGLILSLVAAPENLLHLYLLCKTSSRVNNVGEVVSDLAKSFEQFKLHLGTFWEGILLSSHALFSLSGLQKLLFPFSWRN